jgi:pathogenesis-related protein 1
MFSQWSYEKNFFNPTQKYGSNSSTNSSIDVSHYTQIIWGMTFEVGCGIANSTYYSVLVCQYKYPGNFVGNWVYKPNVTNPWKAAQPMINPAILPPPPTPNTYPTLLDNATATHLLNLHNAERKFVGMKNLTWSPSLAATAQAHANKQAQAGTFWLSGTPWTGENMQLATIRPDIVNYMFNLWANEKIYFDATLRYPQCAIGNKMISHYTQIVWSASYEVGCGLATNARNSILVCQYKLAGNYIGNFAVYPAPKTNFKFTLNADY